MKHTLGISLLAIVLLTVFSRAVGEEDRNVTVFRETVKLKLPASVSPAADSRTSISIEAGAISEVPEDERQTGMARLAHDRAARVAKQDKRVAVESTGSVSTDSPAVARKTEATPLTAEKREPSVPCDRERDILRLLSARDAANNVDESDRLGLRLAAAYVGAGDIEKAKEIYLVLTKSARREAIRQTAKRNLGILAKRDLSEGRGQQ